MGCSWNQEQTEAGVMFACQRSFWHTVPHHFGPSCGQIWTVIACSNTEADLVTGSLSEAYGANL